MKKFVIFLFIFIFFAKPIIAESPKFSVTVENIYKVAPDGNTTVTQNFTLTNLTSEFFPQEFVLPPLDSSIMNLRSSENIVGNNIKFKQPIAVMGTMDALSAEQYHILFTKLEKIKYENSFNTFIVTSAVKGEGKSTTAINLAYIMSKVFIIMIFLK